MAELSDIEGIFELERVDYAHDALAFKGLHENVVVNDGQQLWAAPERWHEWEANIGREYRIRVNRTATDRLLLESILLIPHSDYREGLRLAELEAMERVVKQSLLVAADRFCQTDDDPGFTADYNEDQLRDACTAYRDAIVARRDSERV